MLLLPINALFVPCTPASFELGGWILPEMVTLLSFSVPFGVGRGEITASHALHLEIHGDTDLSTPQPVLLSHLHPVLWHSTRSFSLAPLTAPSMRRWRASMQESPQPGSAPWGKWGQTLSFLSLEVFVPPPPAPAPAAPPNAESCLSRLCSPQAAFCKLVLCNPAMHKPGSSPALRAVLHLGFAGF